MSGTSVDGIDAALVEIEGDAFDGKVRLVAFENKPFPEAIKKKIFDLFVTENATIDKIGYMNVLLGELYAEAVFSVVEKSGLLMSEIDLIGSHGQTIYHHPQCNEEDGYPIHYTVQIGEGSVISNRTHIPCISDFRVADMAAGGQGAPLVPFTEYLLYRNNSKTILLQNLGGIGNITVLPANSSIQEVYAFDTGPGNMIIDGLVSLFTEGAKTMDDGGRIAAGGIINLELLQQLCSHEYFQEKPPKSTGREMFGEKYIKDLYEKIIAANLSMEDAIATVTDFSAWAIEDSYQKYILPNQPADQLLIGGGGSYNLTLVSMIRKRMEQHGVAVYIQEDFGFSSDAKEAIAFALLADCAMAGKCNNVPSVTGADYPVVMGKLSLG
jgi:anhydro-N-acetylmuramic acid kinase